MISREVRRQHGGRADYRAAAVDEQVQAKRERPKKLAVELSPLREVVLSLPRQGWWSPASVAGPVPILSDGWPVRCVRVRFARRHLAARAPTAVRTGPADS